MRPSRVVRFGRRARVRLAITMIAFALLPAAATPAAAAPSKTLAPGVYIDPGSPVAKEYAIPLAQARAGGGSGGGSGSGQPFGSGITRAPNAPSPVPAGTGGASPAAAAPTRRPRVKKLPSSVQHRSGSQDRAGHVVASPAAPAALPGSSHSGAGAGIAWMLGAAALVLALGGLGGAVLARVGRRTNARTS
jgi:hypothetical protein